MNLHFYLQHYHISRLPSKLYDINSNTAYVIRNRFTQTKGNKYETEIETLVRGVGALLAAPTAILCRTVVFDAILQGFIQNQFTRCVWYMCVYMYTCTS